MEHRNDPGAVQYGNFMNYYQFNSATERVKLLPKAEVWSDEHEEPGEVKPYLVLDVGCNCGVFTHLLHEFLEEELKRPVHILGVDIDPRLIQRAEENNTCPESISYACVDVLDETAFEDILDYLEKRQRESLTLFVVIP